MAGPSEIGARLPAVAGTFYPADAAECRAAARSLIRADQGARGKRWFGGIVPHAGWVCSGSIAGLTIGTLAAAAQQGKVDLVVVFGAIHTPLDIDRAALDHHRRWSVPGGITDLPQDIQDRLTADAPRLFGVDERFHAHEHAVEVELPLIQAAWPGVTVLPVEVPVIDDAVTIGRETARLVSGSAKLNAVYLASSDLTHYGPGYRFTPAGVGPAGLEWAKENDQRLLDVVTSLDAERIVPEVESRYNACGGGAIAAMLAACRELGGGEARVLRHANSCETLAEVAADHTSDNAVGYASVVVGE